MDILFIIIGILCLLTGLAGCFLPVIPGPPVAYAGLLLLHFTDKVQYSTTQLLLWLLLVIILQVLTISSPCWAANIAEEHAGERADALQEQSSDCSSCPGALSSARF